MEARQPAVTRRAERAGLTPGFLRYAVASAARLACAYSVSGATSASLGQTIVPDSGSARSWRK
jgi:hypothetical protein